jgi:hypothetical protein
VLELVGLYEEFGYPTEVATGRLTEQVQSSGELDEEHLVAYLDVGHRLTHFMEWGADIISGQSHRHSPGCSSLTTDGNWLWRADLAHYLETYHVPLPAAFLDRIRGLRYEMPELMGADFAPLYRETSLKFEWGEGDFDPDSVLPPPPRAVLTQAEYVASLRQERPVGRWGKGPRKPQRPMG